MRWSHLLLSEQEIVAWANVILPRTTSHRACMCAREYCLIPGTPACVLPVPLCKSVRGKSYSPFGMEQGSVSGGQGAAAVPIAVSGSETLPPKGNGQEA